MPRKRAARGLVKALCDSGSTPEVRVIVRTPWGINQPLLIFSGLRRSAERIAAVVQQGPGHAGAEAPAAEQSPRGGGSATG